MYINKYERPLRLAIEEYRQTLSDLRRVITEQLNDLLDPLEDQLPNNIRSITEDIYRAVIDKIQNVSDAYAALMKAVEQYEDAATKAIDTQLLVNRIMSGALTYEDVRMIIDAYNSQEIQTLRKGSSADDDVIKKWKEKV